MKNGRLKRVLSFVMALVMVLTLLPPMTANAATETRTVYLNAGGSSLWDQAGAWFAAYVWKDGGSATWHKLESFDGAVYAGEIPVDATYVIFIRMASGTTTMDWSNKWNQTGDLTLSADKNCYTITGWGDTDGKWSSYIPRFIVAGEEGLCGIAWNPASTANALTKNSAGLYEKTYTNVAAGTYKFKVTNGTWDYAWPSSDYVLTVPADGSTVVITLNTATKAVNAVVTSPVSVTFNGTNVASDGAAKVMPGADYTAKLTADKGYDLPAIVTVTVGGSEVTGFTYADGTLTIPGALITGDVVITAVAEKTQPTTRIIYLNAGGNSLWDQADAWFDAWVWQGSDGGAWYTFTDDNFDGIYEIEIPSNLTDMKVLRKSPSNTSHDWSYWNETSDLTIPADKNCYTITGWSNTDGKWSVYTPTSTEAVFTVAGASGLCGTNWDTADTANDMVKNADGLYEKVFSNVKAGTYEFKVAANHAWTHSWGNNGGNASVTVAKDGSTVTITFDPATKKVAASVTALVSHSVTFNGTNVTSNGAATAAEGVNYTAKLTADADYNLPATVTVTVGGAAVTSFTYADGTLTIPAALVTGDIVITAVAEKAQPATYTVYFRNDWLWSDVSAYYWGSTIGTNPSWPGVAMTKVDAVDGKDIYAAEIPSDVTGLIFNGLKDDGSGNRDQTPDITAGIADGNAYYIYWDNGNKYGTFEYVPVVSHTVTFNGTNVTSNGAATAAEGVNYTAKLTADADYSLPATVTVTVGGAAVTGFTYADGTLTIPAALVTGDIVITAVAEKAQPATYTVYFRNDWLWSDVSAYYWGSTIGTNPGWPGVAMTKVDAVDGKDIYAAEIPSDVTGLIFNGLKDDGSGNRDQTPDIKTGIADGAAWYIHWDGENKASTFDYTPPTGGGEEPSEPTDSNVYSATFHFVNTLNWNAVNLYTWTTAGAHTGSWPGTSLSTDAKGFYSYTVEYEAETNNGLNFIFNNGSTQTVDLLLPASAFVDNKAEKWVILTTQTDGKYNADILDNGDSIAVSPVVDGTSVTFAYKNASANAVSVAGTMNNWTGAAMTKNEHGIWTLTINDLTPGVHQYKFVVDGNWITDPANSWKEVDGGNENSAFLISDYTKDKNTVTVNIHYTRSDNNYDNWNAYVWTSKWSKQYDLTAEAGGMVTSVVVEGRSVQEVSFKMRKSVGANLWAAEEGQVVVNLSKIVSGTIDVYTGNGTTTQKLGDDVVYDNKITDVQLDYVNNTVVIKTNEEVKNPETAFTLVHVVDGIETDIETKVTASGSTYTLSLKDSTVLDLVKLYQYKVRFSEQKNENYTKVLYDIGIDTVYATDKFASEFTYTTIGKELGASYTAAGTTFRVWAPTAEEVSVKLYATGSDAESGAQVLGTHAMTRGEKGVWEKTVSGDLNNVYYTYVVKVNGEEVEAVDPYARTTGVNGNRGMVIDLDSTDPTGWASDKNPNPMASYTDAVIYELHVRDFSIDASSGVTAGNRGKYMAFTEEGTTVNGNGAASTGIDYLDDLGVTHVHLLPVYDYASVDETTCSNFNWGYDPQNYNTPEGSYSTNPYDGAVRVMEFKEMVKSLHDHDISVVMDVVYNHVYDANTFCFNNIVPSYFSRVDSNTSGCGNDTASEREMVRKYIVESVLYWTEEYHIDGFRFDLVGLLDVQTVNQIVAEVHAVRPDVLFYGEGWNMDGTNKEPGTEMAKQGNASKTPDFAYFSDNMRNLLAGDNGKSTGFVSGSAGVEGDLVSNFMANPWWTSNPQQVVQYVSCHDNHTLVDKLIKSTGATTVNSNIIKMNNLAAAIYMTAQGIPFIHAGEEILREKVNESGVRVENSYNSSDFVNHIQWYDLEDETYTANMEYYKGLIAFRKAHPALSVTSSADVKSSVKAKTASGKIVAFSIDGYVSGDDDIYVIFNANSSAKTVTLPEGEWTIYINGTKAGTDSLGTASGSVSVAGISAMVLTKEDEGKDAVDLTDTVTLYFSNNKRWDKVFAYAWTDNGAVLGEWPGTEMTYETTNEYGEDIFAITIPAACAGVIFHNGASDQTVDLTPGMDGTGYYCTDKNGEGKYECGTYTYRAPNIGSASDYYLVGYINGADYAADDYKFDADGKLTVTFDSDSYVYVRNGDGSAEYWTDGYLGKVSSATLKDNKKCSLTSDKWDKMLVPGSGEVTLTLVVNDDNTVKLSYEVTSTGVVDASGIQNGVTLHCWNWSFAEIEKNMTAIADQGYTAIQTSPVQVLKEATNLETNSVGTHWWVYYQPVDFVITTDSGNALGTKADLESMIATAHRYGIKVIVDVVANHLGNKTGNDLADKIPDYLRKDEYWHDITTNISSWDSRENMTQYCLDGLPDLNTANEEIQGYVLNFLKECVDIGVDGFRFDMAKSIETPRDDESFASDFWPTVIGGAEEYAQSKYSKDLYMYGEILDDAKISISAYTQYMAVTDNGWGNHLRTNVVNGNASLVEGFYKAADASQLVIWAESHDTYANGESTNVSVADINKTWALVAARANAMGLYLARPESMEQDLGTASVTAWANDEVEAVNEFHNAFVGQGETIGNENGISYVERGTNGAVLVKVTAASTRATSNAVSVTANAMADGTYKDQLTGNIFTVANGKITGEIGATGIAVIYNIPEYDVEVENTTGGKAEVSNKKPAPGDKVTITVTPDEGKQVEKVTVTDAQGNNVPVVDNGNGTYTFTQPEGDVTVKVTFQDIPVKKYNVTLEVGTGGKAEVSNKTPEAGETVKVTVKPNSGKLVNTVTATDDAGKSVTVKKNSDDTYSFVQPESDVKVVVTFKAKTASANTGDDSRIGLWITLTAVSALAVIVLVNDKRRKNRNAM